VTDTRGPVQPQPSSTLSYAVVTPMRSWAFVMVAPAPSRSCDD
jgi:hypothetical protein